MKKQNITIDCFLLCYNEEKMVRHTLNHYLKFCRQITVFDNYSTDKTCKIITSEYSSHNIKIEKFDTGNQIRDDIYLEIKNNCWKKSDASYVIVCDMDELLNITDVFLHQQKYMLLMNTTPLVIGYNMLSDYFPDDYSRPIIQQITTGVRALHFDKQIIFSPSEIKEINYLPGAHKYNPEGNLMKNIQFPLRLLHYKYLGKEYIKERHAVYAARLSEFNKQLKFGAEYSKGDDFIDLIFEKSKSKLQNVI